MNAVKMPLFAAAGKTWLDRETIWRNSPRPGTGKEAWYAYYNYQKLMLHEYETAVNGVQDDFSRLEDVDAKFTVHPMAPGGFFPSLRGFNDLREAVVTHNGRELVNETEQKRFLFFPESAKHFCKRILKETQAVLRSE